MPVPRLKTAVRVTVASTVGAELVQAYAQETALKQDPDLAGIMGTLEAQEQKLTAALYQQTTLSLVDEKNCARNAIIRDLAKAIAGYTAIPVEPIASSIHDVAAVFNLYGVSICSEPRAVESAKINSLFGNMDEPTIQEKIKNLPGIGELLSSLHRAEKEYDEARTAYDSAIANSKEEVCASNLKPEFIETFNTKLAAYLTGQVAVKPDLFTHFATVVTQIIERANSSVKGKKPPNPEEY